MKLAEKIYPDTELTPSILPTLKPGSAEISLQKREIYSAAVNKMLWGKRLVIGGFGIAILGIVFYCCACLSGGINPGGEGAFLQNPEKLVGPALGVIGLGTLSWLIGSFLYLNGAMDSDPEGPDLYF